MRRFLVLVLFLCPSPSRSSVAADARSWLDRAADTSLTLREREYAARQVLMLADSSASILIDAVADEGAESGLRRQVAARLLGELAPAGAEAALLAASVSRDYFLARAASASLVKLYAGLSDEELHSLYRRGGREAGTVPGGAEPGADDWLVLSLETADAKARCRTLVLRALDRKYRGSDAHLPPALVECVREALTDAYPELRESAIPLVVRCADGESAERLAAFLHVESEPRLIVAALRAMAAMRPADFGESVERHVGHDDPAVQLEALAALDAMGYENAMFPAVPGARAAAVFVSHPSTPIRRRAIEILGGTRNPAALDHLHAGTFDRVGQNRAAAARALGGLGFAAAAGFLTPLLNDDYPEARFEAALALDRLGVVGVVSRMLDDLEKGRAAALRRSAAIALGRLGDEKAAPALVAALVDPDVELACLAAEALGRLGFREAIGPLRDIMVSTPEPVLMDAARLALAGICRDDPGVTPASWESWARRNRLGE